MPVVKVRDIAFGRLQSPDLDQAEQFLLDFGMEAREIRGGIKKFKSALCLTSSRAVS